MPLRIKLFQFIQEGATASTARLPEFHQHRNVGTLNGTVKIVIVDLLDHSATLPKPFSRVREGTIERPGSREDRPLCDIPPSSDAIHRWNTGWQAARYVDPPSPQTDRNKRSGS